MLTSSTATLSIKLTVLSATSSTTYNDMFTVLVTTYQWATIQLYPIIVVVSMPSFHFLPVPRFLRMSSRFKTANSLHKSISSLQVSHPLPAVPPKSAFQSPPTSFFSPLRPLPPPLLQLAGSGEVKCSKIKEAQKNKEHEILFVYDKDIDDNMKVNTKRGAVEWVKFGGGKLISGRVRKIFG
ncbi:hypothetical protein BJ878DRAFT_511434 [Calycina marina]|uniref:Uncharacterized protein n=1 Tax=Calycina marina TaxID=1763456 RepID=A0A9P7Z0U8_9HELO|nr:hypothetical protein BJ878DRAFT_511434 [Calycina marina]